MFDDDKAEVVDSVEEVNSVEELNSLEEELKEELEPKRIRIKEIEAKMSDILSNNQFSDLSESHEFWSIRNELTQLKADLNLK